MRKHLFDDFCYTLLGNKIKLRLKQILEIIRDRNGIVIFMSRKGYWLFNIYRMHAGWGKEILEGVKVYSDRFVSKWVEDWLGVPIYIVDDTVSTGISMYNTFCKVYIALEKYKKEKNSDLAIEIHCIALFIRMSKQELETQMRSELSDTEYLTEFMNSFETIERVYAEQIGLLSYEQVFLFQKLMIPYVVDLPVVTRRSENLSDNLNIPNDFAFFIEEESFEKLLNIRGDWEYVDNSYFWDNLINEIAETERINCGFFRCIEPNIYEKIGDVLFQLVVKCRYEKYENGYYVTLTPFAILGSMSQNNAIDLCRILYKDTDFVNELQRIGQKNEADKIEDNRFSTLLLRSIVYFFSMYTWKSFYAAISSILSKPLLVDIDTRLLHENSKKVFIDVVEKMNSWTQIRFWQQFQDMSPKNENALTHKPEKVRKILEPEDTHKAYLTMYKRVIDKKRENISDAFVSIEDLYKTISKEYEQCSEQAQKVLFIQVLLQMLDQSVLGNSVASRDGYIFRGFRFGENSDISLPFYNSYLYYAVQQLYSRCFYQVSGELEHVKTLFFDKVRMLLSGIKNLAIKNGYFNVLINNEDFEWYEWYFTDKRADLRTLVENKQFRINKDRRIQEVDNDVASCLDELFIV